MRTSDPNLLRDYLIFVAGFISGGLIIGIVAIHRYDKKLRASFKKLLRSPKLYTPPGGIDISKGIHFGRIKGMNRRVYPRPLHGGGPKTDEEELDLKALKMLKQGIEFTKIFQEIYRPTYPFSVLDDPVDLRKAKANIKRRLKRKYPDQTL